MLRVFLLLLAALGLASAAGAGWPRLPPIEGDLAGKIAAPAFPAAPAIDWKITVRPGARGHWHAELITEAPGAHLRVHADFDPATGDGAWSVGQGELDAAVWFPAVAAKLGDVLGGAEVAGKISISGEGGLHGGVPDGAAVLALTGGRFALPKQKLEFTGIAVRLTLPQVPRAAMKGELTFTEGRATNLGLSDGRVGFELDEAGGVHVSEVKVHGLGGVLTVVPFHFDPARPEIAVALKLVGVELGEIVTLLPPALSEARGRVDGELALTWSKAAGLGFGAGSMRLTDGATATVRLSPAPGLITAQLSAGNPAFASLQRVELGQTPLKVRLLSADFSPAGDALGRTGSVRLEAEPLDAQLIAPIQLDVNVAGPLDQLIKLGLDDRVRMGGPRG